MDLNEALTQFVTGLIGLLALVITTFVIPWIRANTTAKQREMAVAIVHASVGMVKQVAPKHTWSNAQKKEQAEKYARRLMSQYGVVLKDEELNVLIESTVNELNTILTQFEMVEETVVEEETDKDGA